MRHILLIVMLTASIAYADTTESSITFTISDMGLEVLGRGSAQLTQTEIAPEIYLLKVSDVQPAPGVRFGGEPLGYVQLGTLLGRCAVWHAGKSRGLPYSFSSPKPSPGNLVAFLPREIPPTSLQARTGGTLQEWSQSLMSSLKRTCEDLPKSLKASNSPGAGVNNVEK